MGPGASAAAPTLAETMKDMKNPGGIDRRDFVAEALGRIGPGAGPGVVPVLVAIVKNREEDESLRRACIHALGDLGPAAVDAIPVLTDFQSDPAIGKEAVAALGKLRTAADRARRE
jgi:HEAT repeat protein